MEFRSQKSEIGGQKSENGRQKSEVRVQNSEVRSQISDIQPPTSDIRPPTSDYRSQTSDLCLPYWQNVLDKIKQSGKMTVYANLIGTKGILINDLLVGIEFPGKVTEFAKKVLEEHENKAMIEKIISMEQGSPMQIKILDKSEKNKKTSKKDEIENLADEMDLPLNVIDE